MIPAIRLVILDRIIKIVGTSLFVHSEAYSSQKSRRLKNLDLISLAKLIRFTYTDLLTVKLPFYNGAKKHSTIPKL
jgi:hypothetical protein